MRELRKQMSQARSLKDTSQPEFEEKLNRLKQLRDMRKVHLDKVRGVGKRPGKGKGGRE